MARSEFMRQSRQARISLDAKLPAMHAAAKVLARPRGGWMHAIRLALGMSASDLAAKLQVAPSTIHRFEANEVAGTIQLESLTRVAKELGCDVVYALVPRQEVEATVNKRAREVASRALRPTQQTMALEQQGLQEDIVNRLIDQKARELAESTGLWREKKDNVP